MTLRNKISVFLLFLGDIVALYLALLITLFLRYGEDYHRQFLAVHFGPFTAVFIAWLIIFYIAGLYDLRRLRNDLDFLKTLALCLITNAIVAVLVFYLVHAFGIAPKTNLFIVIVLFTLIELAWRRAWNRMTESSEAPNRVALVGDGEIAEEVALALAKNRQLGYSIVARLSEEEADRSPDTLHNLIRDFQANLIVVPRELKRKSTLTPVLYQLFGNGTVIADLDTFYEIIMRRVPVSEIGETWFLENVEAAAKFYDELKRAFEFFLALGIGIVLLPVELLIAILVGLTSHGPVIYRQIRAGRSGRPFTLYKFRTMRVDAEPDGNPQWAIKKDPRVTPLGRLLRATHLDELPQLWNIIRGDLSFVGPRPERPEFVEKLKAQIPFYEVRLLIKPGVTGWAQINHRADLTLHDVKQKLQYDIYYLKNRSPILDLAIVLKTLKSVFVNPK